MYLTLKTLHILAVVAFLGNISVGIFWKTFADRSRNAQIIAHTLAGIIKADRIITIPSIFAIVFVGMALASIGGYPILGTGWMLWSIALFVLAGVAFVPLTRLQRQLLTTARSGLDAAADQQKYRDLSHHWDVWGVIALVLPLAAMVLMVMKPALPALHR